MDVTKRNHLRVFYKQIVMSDDVESGFLYGEAVIILLARSLT